MSIGISNFAIVNFIGTSLRRISGQKHPPSPVPPTSLTNGSKKLRRFVAHFSAQFTLYKAYPKLVYSIYIYTKYIVGTNLCKVPIIYSHSTRSPARITDFRASLEINISQKKVKYNRTKSWRRSRWRRHYTKGTRCYNLQRQTHAHTQPYITVHVIFRIIHDTRERRGGRLKLALKGVTYRVLLFILFAHSLANSVRCAFRFVVVCP